MNIPRPPFESIPLVDGLRWRGGSGWRMEWKLDGVFHQLDIGRSIIVGELMANGEFYAFDIPIFQGQDVRRAPLHARLDLLDGFKLLRPATGQGGEFLEHVLAAGGEGIVAKGIDSRYGDTSLKCKRLETHDCRIAEIHPEKKSIRLEQAGQNRGWCPALGNTLERLAVGDMVEVACHSIHRSGFLREARIIRTRKDKS